MTDESLPPQKNIQLRFIIAIALVLIVCVGWWFAWRAYSQGHADFLSQSLFRDEPGGLVCVDRQSGGFPFRLSETCKRIEIGGAVRFDAERLTVTTLPYQLQRTIFQLDGPLRFNSNALSSSPALSWSLARASLRHDFERLVQFDAELNDATFNGVVNAPWKALNSQFHLRQTPQTENSADLSFSVTGLVSEAIEGPQAIDAIALASVEPGLALLYGQPNMLPVEWQRADGATLKLTDAQIVIDAGRLRASGEFEINEDGYLTGDLRLEIDRPEGLVNALADYLPPLPVSAGTIVRGIETFSAANAEDDGRILTISLTRGHANLGILPLGRVPSLFSALTAPAS